MRDPMTFEARLADAFEEYAIGAPVAVDSRALAAALGRRPQARTRPLPVLSWPASRTLRVALVVTLLALAAIVAVLAAGARRAGPTFPAADSRLLVWLPSGGGDGAATLLAGDGTILRSRGLPSSGCPQLIGGTENLAVPGFGGLTLEPMDDSPGVLSFNPPTRLNTNYAGFERWSPDRRSVALVDMEHGPVTVVRLTNSAPQPRSTAYPLAGALDAAFSKDGTRLVVAVPGTGPGILDIHDLRDGSDRVVNSLTVLDNEPVRLALSPDGSRLAVLLASELRTPELGRPRIMLVSLEDGSMSDARVPAQLPSPIELVSWSPDGRTLAVRNPSTLWLLDSATRTWTDTGDYFHGGVGDSRWSTNPSDPGIAILDPGGHLHVSHLGTTRIGKQILLWGSAAAFSPDGSAVAAIATISGNPYERGDAAAVELIDVWGDGEPRTLATLPPLTSGVLDPDLIPCIDWLPGGGS